MRVPFMKTYTMTETAKKLGVHRQTMINWIRKGWVKPKRDYKDWPVFTDECIAKIKEWRDTLKDTDEGSVIHKS
jgi:predicted site-specific integrase-resolvase